MMTPVRRPFGVTLIALLYLLETIIALGLGAYLLLSPTSFSIYSTLFERLQLSAALAGLLAAPPLLAALLAALIFRGLWQGRDWARLAAMVIAFLVLLAIIAAIAFLVAFDYASTRSLAAALVLAFLCLAAFIYLARVRFAGPEPGVALPHTASQAAMMAPFPPAEPQPYQPLPPVRPAAATAAAYQPVAGSLVPPPPRPAPVTSSAVLEAPPRHVGDEPAPPELLVAAAIAAQESSQSDIPPPVAAQSAIDSATTASGDAEVVESLAAIAPAMPTLLIPEPAPATEPPPSYWLVVRNGILQGQVFPLTTAREVVIGRDPQRSDICLQDPTVSARHALLRYENGRCVLYDLKSTNGTYLGGIPLERQPLQDGDELQLGSTLLLFLTQQP